ncbi:urease subunit beta [Corynebacterium bovis]|uniref:Urease subunit beta n=1 Tax=Corynebacterium bovis TaxID=36808 RepID=A0A426PWL5_9CORY|nr:urease subunit beta [Corynebacterium bovis]MDN8578541.1 urease subunit beta [Corynebacterium bovis]RRO85787.1 urease subunit beta [Corynebacterium bovis]
MSGSTTAYEIQPGVIDINAGRRTITLTVENRGDRAVQVGSHYHFFEVNAGLTFDRRAAWGMHLAIPSGLAVRFEPGDEKDVEFVEFGGRRIIHGFAGLVEGALDDPEVRDRAFAAIDGFVATANTLPEDAATADALPGKSGADRAAASDAAGATDTAADGTTDGTTATDTTDGAEGSDGRD